MSRHAELVAKVDAFFARVEARHGSDMQCRTGCSDCCHTRLSITGVEADAIRAELQAWPAERRAALAQVVAAAPPDRCAALDAAGRCGIYAARPLVCRSHGVPVRLSGRSLPVVIEACFRNFTHTTSEVEPGGLGPTGGIDADCVLDQATLSATLLAVDRDAGHDGTRVDLAALLADC